MKCLLKCKLVNLLFLRLCLHLVPEHLCLGTGTKWGCVHTRSSQDIDTIKVPEYKVCQCQNALRPIKAWAKNSERPPAMIYSDLFSLLFCKCLAVVGVSESLRRMSFEMPAFASPDISFAAIQFNNGEGDNYKKL